MLVRELSFWGMVDAAMRPTRERRTMEVERMVKRVWVVGSKGVWREEELLEVVDEERE